jgi:hypothetical protein
MEFQPMSPPEEIERTGQFLLHQQAKFAADFDKQPAKTDRMGHYSALENAAALLLGPCSAFPADTPGHSMTTRSSFVSTV